MATDPDALRQGVVHAIVQRTISAAKEAGVLRMDRLSTRTAVPFYASMGFRQIGPVEVPLRPGIFFPAVQMTRDFT